MLKNDTSTKQKSSWLSEPDFNHIVQFYPDDGDLISSLIEYITCGLKNGETCIAIATPGHTASLNAALRGRGIDLQAAITGGQYMIFDVDETLKKFMDREMPDHQLFMKAMGRVMTLAAGRGQPIRVFGEMVAALWQKGNAVGMLRLEEYWQSLLKEQTSSLYCAYPEAIFDGSPSHREAIDEISNCHALAIG